MPDRRIICALSLLLLGCGGVSSSGRESSAQKGTSTSPPSSSTGLSPEFAKAWEQFSGEINWALAEHLKHSPQERPQLLAKAYQDFLKGFQKVSDHPEWGKAATDLLASAPASIDSWEPYLSAAERLSVGPDAAESFRNVLRGNLFRFLPQLDYFSRYLPPDVPRAQFSAGIRIRSRTDYLLGRKPSYYIIDGTYPDSPNNKLEPTFKTLNHLVKVGDQPASEFAIGQLEDRLNRSLSEAPVDITIQGSNSQEAQQVSLQMKPRSLYKQSPSIVRVLDEKKGIAVIRLEIFSIFSFDSFKTAWNNAVQTLSYAGAKPIRGLLIDFRGNSGGFDKEAYQIASWLVPAGQVLGHRVSVNPKETSDGLTLFGKTVTYEPMVSKDEEAKRIPVPAAVVLTDRASASSTEIATAALMDNDRVFGVGEPSLGKAIGQAAKVLPEPLYGLIAVTDSVHFSPEGKPWQGTRLKPDVPRRDVILDRYQGKRPFTMAELKREHPDRIFDPLPSLRGIHFAPPKDAPVTPEIREKLKAIPLPKLAECERLPGQKGFREEDDCLLATGRFYLEELMRLLGEREPVAPRG